MNESLSSSNVHEFGYFEIARGVIYGRLLECYRICGVNILYVRSVQYLNCRPKQLQRDARYAESQLCGMPFYHYSTGAQALRNGLKSARGRILKMRILRFERENFLSFPSSFFVTSPLWYRGRSGPQTFPEILQRRDVGILSGGLLFRPGTERTLEEE